MQISTILAAVIACTSVPFVFADLSFDDIQGTVMPWTPNDEPQAQPQLQPTASTAEDVRATNDEPSGEVDEHGYPVNPPANASHPEDTVTLPRGLYRSIEDGEGSVSDAGGFEDRAFAGDDDIGVFEQVYDADGLPIYHRR